MPELKPTERCGNLFNEWDMSRFIETLDGSKRTVFTAFDSIARLDIAEWICSNTTVNSFVSSESNTCPRRNQRFASPVVENPRMVETRVLSAL